MLKETQHFAAELFEARIVQRLTLLREQKKWDQKTLAVKVGLSQSAMSRIEHHEIHLNLRQLFRICEALGVNPKSVMR